MILVTGVTGRSGAAVVREFVRHGTPVRALVRTRAKVPELENLPSVELVEGDMLWPETLESALHGVTRVLMISSAGPQLLETQCTFVDAAKKAGVGQIIKFSGAESGVGFEPANFRFTRSHEQAQRYLEGSGVAWTHLRPSQFMQMYLQEVPKIVAGGTLSMPMGAARLSPVDIDDIAKVAHLLLRDGGHEGRSYDMTGPEALTMAEIAAHIAEATGRPVRYVDVAPEEKRQEWLDAGFDQQRVDAFAQLFAERRKHLESKVVLDTHREFGIEPTTFAEFASRHAKAFRGE